MSTLIICENKECMHAKKRKDNLYQCCCTAIGINNKNECDTYMVLPPAIKKKLQIKGEIENLKPGQPCGHPGCCSHISHPCEGCGRVGCQ